MNDAADRATAPGDGPTPSLTQVMLGNYQALFESYVDANRNALAFGQSLLGLWTRPYTGAFLSAPSRAPSTGVPPQVTAAAATVTAATVSTPDVATSLEPQPASDGVEAHAVDPVSESIEAHLVEPATQVILASGASDVVEETVQTFLEDASRLASAEIPRTRKRHKKSR